MGKQMLNCSQQRVVLCMSRLSAPLQKHMLSAFTDYSSLAGTRWWYHGVVPCQACTYACRTRCHCRCKCCDHHPSGTIARQNQLGCCIAVWSHGGWGAGHAPGLYVRHRMHAVARSYHIYILTGCRGGNRGSRYVCLAENEGAGTQYSTCSSL